MMIKKITLCLVLLAALAACGGRDTRPDRAPERRTLAVSIEPLRAMLEPLAQGRFDVISVMDRGTDAELFEPSMSRRVAAESASGIFITGLLPFEKALAATLPDSVGAVDLSRCVDLIYGTHDHGAADGAEAADTTRRGMPDPHIWTSVRNARRITAAMAAELVRLDPAWKDVYAARLDSIDKVLAGLDQYAVMRLRNAPSKAFVVWHPSLSYFARDYGLRQVVLGSDGKDMSVAQLRRAIEDARASGARVFLTQRGSSSRSAGSVSAEAGTRLVQFDALSAEWQEMIKRLTDELSRN